MEFRKHTYPKLSEKTWKWSKENNELVRIYNDIYCDQLCEIFEKVTGLYTRLF